MRKIVLTFGALSLAAIPFFMLPQSCRSAREDAERQHQALLASGTIKREGWFPVRSIVTSPVSLGGRWLEEITYADGPQESTAVMLFEDFRHQDRDASYSGTQIHGPGRDVMVTVLRLADGRELHLAQRIRYAERKK